MKGTIRTFLKEALTLILLMATIYLWMMLLYGILGN